MLWTIVIALIFVFWILPMVLTMVGAFFSWLAEELGCGGAIFVGIVILILILIF